MTNRTDVSDYLIHFVRSPSKTDFPTDYKNMEEFYFPLIEGEISSQYDCLTNIIEEGGLRASCSFRNGKATIYGADPVICFTEMPLLNLLQYAASQNNTSRVSEYGIALLKKEVYNLGARPVIYGLSNDNKFKYEDGNKKIISPEILPYCEQYRFVNLNLNTDGYTDWTHEREWRIKCSEPNYYLSISDDDYLNTICVKGLNIFTDLFFSEVVIILKTIEEAEEVRKIVQQQLDSGYARGGDEFNTKIRFLVIDNSIKFLNTTEINSIEDLPKDSYYIHEYESISEIDKEMIRNSINTCSVKAKDFAKEFFDTTKLAFDEYGALKDTCGSAHVASFDTENKYIRFMLSEELAVAVGGCVWIKIENYDIPSEQSITYYEFIAEKQCEILNKVVSNIFRVYSMRD